MARSKIAIGLVTVFIAVFMLLYIFNQVQNLADSCGRDPSYSSVCSQLSSFTISMMIILLIVGGFFFIITVAAYVLLSA